MFIISTRNYLEEIISYLGLVNANDIYFIYYFIISTRKFLAEKFSYSGSANQYTNPKMKSKFLFEKFKFLVDIIYYWINNIIDIL